MLLTSCNYFSTKKVYTEDLLNEEMQSINWNDVDEYPTFSTCDSTATNLDKKACFERQLRDLLNAQLSKQNIVVTEDVNDTITLKIRIDNQGHFAIKNIEMKALTQTQIPQLDSILRHSFDSLPKIYPAIKRSQQVATEFSLPVVIDIK